MLDNPDHSSVHCVDTYSTYLFQAKPLSDYSDNGYYCNYNRYCLTGKDCQIDFLKKISTIFDALRNKITVEIKLLLLTDFFGKLIIATLSTSTKPFWKMFIRPIINIRKWGASCPK